MIEKIGYSNKDMSLIIDARGEIGEIQYPREPKPSF